MGWVGPRATCFTIWWERQPFWESDETLNQPQKNQLQTAFCSKHSKGLVHPLQPLLDPLKGNPHLFQPLALHNRPNSKVTISQSQTIGPWAAEQQGNLGWGGGASPSEMPMPLHPQVCEVEAN